MHYLLNPKPGVVCLKNKELSLLKAIINLAVYTELGRQLYGSKTIWANVPKYVLLAFFNCYT